MFFGSKYVYRYDHSEEESVSEDDEPIASDTAGSSEAARRDASPRGSSQRGTRSQNRRKKHLRKPDTNVISIKFNRLLQPGEMHAGDPIRCGECGAIASNLTKIERPPENANPRQQQDEQMSIWRCEFCSHSNQVDIDQSDLPKKEDATYLINPAPVVQGSDMSGLDDSMVIFVIDISGSMSSTTLIEGNGNIDTANRDQLSLRRRPMVQTRAPKYMSRLEGVQMAVATNLDKLARENPTKRALLLTFNHELTYYGDGTRIEPLVIRGDKLNNYDEIVREAERETNNQCKPVSESRAKLTETVQSLEEGGQTALGPAVIFALAVASKRPGSRLVICTDGLANRGLGDLESAQDEKIDPDLKRRALDQGNQFYAELTEKALNKGVSISVITIKGTTCLLPIIGQMADGTGGSVTIVDLMSIRDEFASILEQQVIATNVEATLLLHKGLYIRNPDNLDEKLQRIIRKIGNVTKTTEVTFEFGVTDRKELMQKYHIDLDSCKQIPFQIQVTYKGADGSEALRVLTQLKETTSDRNVAEVHAVRSVIADNHIRNTATDTMLHDSNEDDDEDGDSKNVKKHHRWTKPVFQKQRLAYMDRLNERARLRTTEEADEFNEERWESAKNDLCADVLVRGKSRAFKASSSGARAAPPSNLDSKRSYGFRSDNASRFDDCRSENLYRYKNYSTDHTRRRSPSNEKPDKATGSSTEKSKTKKK